MAAPLGYEAPILEVQTLLLQGLNAEARLQALPTTSSDVDAALIRQVLDEAGQFVKDHIAPLNAIGDTEGAIWNAGKVCMPKGFVAAYQTFVEAGWPALSCHVEDGGQGLPVVLEAILYEWLSGANQAWTMAPALLHGAYACIKQAANPELQARYAAKLASGEWLSTMCLTESDAGSDLGAIRTLAVPTQDGRYAITGNKLFISGGEHDLTPNIVHLVLARTPDAPKGSKGLSLFVVSKWDEQGHKQAIYCERIEHKMGLHGSPTCQMRFEGAVGDLIGELGRGLQAMFVMMNAARLHVALQGVGLLDAAHQKAMHYAHERHQMRAPDSQSPIGQADAIIKHPIIERTLQTQKAWLMASKAMNYETGLALDEEAHHPDPKRRHQAQQWCYLMTPLLKSTCTEQGFLGISQCLQVFGGHGYIHEWGIEQHLRDARITMLYEGTNEIQANDFWLRKVGGDGGKALHQVVTAWLEQAIAAGTDDATTYLITLERAAHEWCEWVKVFWQSSYSARCCAVIAPDALRITALLMFGLTLHLMVQRLAKEDDRWVLWQQVYMQWIWPEYAMRMQILKTTIKTTIEVSYGS